MTGLWSFSDYCLICIVSYCHAITNSMVENQNNASQNLVKILALQAPLEKQVLFIFQAVGLKEHFISWRKSSEFLLQKSIKNHCFLASFLLISREPQNRSSRNFYRTSVSSVLTYWLSISFYISHVKKKNQF